MDRNESHEDDLIEIGDFYYIGDEKGLPLSRKRFTTPDEAAQHYTHCMRKTTCKAVVWHRWAEPARDL